MLSATPVTSPFHDAELAAAIDACAETATVCTQCADADLAEPEVEDLRRCIGLDLDCADICSATARVLARNAHYDVFTVQRLLEACVRACAECARECERHADHHRHCALCADACRGCEQACRALLEAEAFEEVKSLAGG